MKNAVNSQRTIWFMQGIYYEWLTPIVLWMNCSNLHLMCNNKVVLFAVQIWYANANLILILFLFRKLFIDHKAAMIRSSIWNFLLCLVKPSLKVNCRTWNIKSGRHFVFHLWSVSTMNGSHDDDLGFWF